MGDPEQYIASVKDLECMLELFERQANIHIHDARIKLPKVFRNISFWDGIVLGPTFFSQRTRKKYVRQMEKKYSWIKDSKAIKIALPQDDYDCSKILDEWLVRWKFDYCITPVTKHLDALYPKFSKQGIIEKGFTAYISDKWIQKWVDIKPTNLRKTDISYRATHLPANFGSLGQLKSQIAKTFTESFNSRILNLEIDISCRPEDKLYGDLWHDFLENSKFTLATPSGSSLIDTTGKIRECVSSQTAEKSFAQIANICFPELDNKYIFDCIGPRHIEAALAGTVMIATEGEYSNVLVADEHYIKLEKDCSNIDEILEKINDHSLVNQIMLKAKEKVLSIPELRLSWIANRCFNWIPDKKELESLKTYTQMFKIMHFRVLRFYIKIKTFIFWIFYRRIILLYRMISKFI